MDNECLLAALGLLLIIPDVCGKLIYPNLSKVHDSKIRFIKWYDEYIGNYEKPDFENGNILPYLNGEVIYKLRCGFFHSGNTDDITKNYQEFNLDDFILMFETKKPYDVYGDTSHKIGDKTCYALNIRRLAVIILAATKATLEKIKSKNLKYKKVKILDIDELNLQRRIINEKNHSLANKNPIIHKMKLRPEPFKAIKLGLKKVELRLDDEKRQKLRVGDFIEFFEINTKDKIVVKIYKLNHFKNFKDLYNAYPNKTILGYKECEAASYNDMLDYYNIEDINLYGTLAIEFELLNK